MKRGLPLSLPLFLLACCLPALEFRNSSGPNDLMWGGNALFVGWSGLFAGVFAWYANPLWAIGLLLAALRKPLAGIVVGLISLAIAATTLHVVGRELPGDEGNVTRMTVVRSLPGFYVWLASLATLPIFAGIAYLNARPTQLGQADSAGKT